MAIRKTTSGDTNEQRAQHAVKSDVSPDVAPSEPTQTSDAPDVATAALREFVRAVARAAARRDWDAAIQSLTQKETTDDSKTNTSAE